MIFSELGRFSIFHRRCIYNKFTDAEIKEAVELQQKAYQLLMWLKDHISDTFIPPEHAHQFMSDAKAAESWINEHYLNYPLDCRPDREQIPAFANLFSSFLLTSFEIDPNPGKILYSPDAHCFCPLCSWLITASHLKTKKPTRSDKMRARELKEKTLRQLVLNLTGPVDEEKNRELIESEEIGQAVSMVAYTRELIKRMQGNVEGPAVLVLWREFAWEKTGSPKKGFKFSAKLAIESKGKVERALMIKKV